MDSSYGGCNYLRNNLLFMQRYKKVKEKPLGGRNSIGHRTNYSKCIIAQKWRLCNMAKGIVRKIDELGRITLPIEIRRSLDLYTGDRLVISLEGQVIKIKRKESRGMTRPLDHLGRIALPVEYRRMLGLKEHKEVDMYIEGDDVCIEKVGCIFCGSSEGLIEVEGIQICRKHALVIHDMVMEG